MLFSLKSNSRAAYCLFLGILLGGLLCEAILWSFFPLPYRLDSAPQQYHQNLPGLKSEVTFSKNEFGVRSLSMRAGEKYPDTIRILCLGASTTEQSTQNIQDTWYGILDRLLNERFQKRGFRIEVAAWGEGGFRVEAACNFCKKELPFLEPDLVVLFWGINDLAFGGRPSNQNGIWESRWGDETGIFSLIRAWKNWLKRHSQLYRRLRLLSFQMSVKKKLREGKFLDWSSANLPILRAKYQQLPYRKEPRRGPDPLFKFQDGLEELMLCVKGLGSRVIVMSQPVLWEKEMTQEEKEALWFYIQTPEGAVRADPEWLVREMRRFNNSQKEIAEKHQAVYVPLDQMIPQTLEYFFDDAHFTDKGSRAVASALYPWIVSQVEAMVD